MFRAADWHATPVNRVADRGQAAPEPRGAGLPAELTSFVGREEEVGRVVRLHATVRLLTLTGAGGVGKSRLALRVAGAVAPGYAGGVRWVDLEPVADPPLVAQTVADALGLHGAVDRSPLEALVAGLADRPTLLLLDNCEHLVDACAELAAVLLTRCPGLRILATSREPLGMTGEVVWSVPPLPVPASARPVLAEEIEGYAAVRLFVERARAARPGFALRGEDAAAVAGICRRLDGLPLAIELAAAWVRVLGPDEIAARLGGGFDLLVGGARSAPARHRTLRAAVDWSWGLLAEPERAVLRRLGAFAGRCTLEAVEAVCSGEDVPAAAVLSLLAALVDKSLVLAEQDGERRYRLLEPICAYAGEKLRDAGEEHATRRRHRDWCLALAEEAFLALIEAAEGVVTGPQEAAWLDRLEREHDSLRAALRWSGEHPGEVEDGLRLAGALGQFWRLRGHATEGRAWLAALLGGADDAPRTPARARALAAAGELALHQGDDTTAGEALAESLAIARELGDERLLLRPLVALAMLTLRRGRAAPGAGRPFVEEAAAIARRVGLRQPAMERFWVGIAALQEGDRAAARAAFEQSREWAGRAGERRTMASASEWLGHVALEGGDPATATACYAESLAIYRGLVMPLNIAQALQGLGLAAVEQTDWTRARELLAESLAIQQDLGGGRDLAATLEGLAAVAAAQTPTAPHPAAQAARVLRLAGAASAVRDDPGPPLTPAQRSRLGRWLAPARAALDEAAGARAAAEGRAMPRPDAVAYALASGVPTGIAGPPPAASTQVPPSPLSAREREVAALVARGHTNRRIAEELVLSHRTVDRHVANALAKLGLTSRAHLAAWAVTHGLTEATGG